MKSRRTSLVINPRDGALFEQANQPAAKSTEETEDDDTQEERCIEQATEQELTQIQGSLEQGQKVAVLGIVPNPAAKHAYIIAGSITRQYTGEVQPVAVQIDTHTLLRKQTGEHFLLEALPTLQAGHDDPRRREEEQTRRDQGQTASGLTHHTYVQLDRGMDGCGLREIADMLRQIVEQGTQAR